MLLILGTCRENTVDCAQQRYTENQIQRYVLNIPRQKKRGTQQRYTDEQIQRYMLGTSREK